MAVDSRAKGARAEMVVRDEMRKLTGLRWERIPASGALSAVHQLKGDLYIPGEYNHYCVEVKHYAEDSLSSTYLTGVNPQLSQFWEQTVRESGQVNKKPLLIYKYDRSKLYACMDDLLIEQKDYPHRYLYSHEGFYITRLEQWVNFCKPEWTK